MECPPAYSVPPPQVSLQEIDGVACTAAPSLFLRRAPRGLSTSLDLLPLSMIYILFCLLLFIAVFITSSSVHLTALRVFLPSQFARYRASSLPLLHLEGNERSAAYLAFNAFTQFVSSACHWLVGWSSVPLHNYISTLCMACFLDCTTCVFLWFNVFGFASRYEISLPLNLLLSSFYTIVHSWSRSDVGSTPIFLNEPSSSWAESTKVKMDQIFDKLVILVFKWNGIKESQSFFVGLQSNGRCRARLRARFGALRKASAIFNWEKSGTLGEMYLEWWTVRLVTYFS